MALNTQQRRQSATGVGRAWMRGSVEPTGAIDQAERQSIGLIYCCNLVGGTVIVISILPHSWVPPYGDLDQWKHEKGLG